MRTTAGSALAGLLIAGALAAPASAATLRAPGTIAPGEMLAVTAEGLDPGRWAVFVSRNDGTGRPCLGRLARRTAEPGEPTVFSGPTPRSLRCPGPIPGAARRQPQPPVPPAPDAPMPVEPGRGYRLVVCVPSGRDCAQVPADRVRVQAVPAGRRCPIVVFTPDSDHGAFGLRARNVTCAVATRVARRAEGGDRRYRRAGLRCRGVFDDHGLPQTVYRCTRPGARVTFTAS